MVISAADGGPDEGRNGDNGEGQGLPIDPGSWQEHLEGEAQAAADQAGDYAGEQVNNLGEGAIGAATGAFGAAVAGAGATIGSAFDSAPQTDRLALGDEERLPWLESADDVDLDEPASDSGRILGFAVFAVLLLFALVGGIYWATHRGGAPAAADGSTIPASTEPYKVAPADPGGKTFEGTGDVSFPVSEGQKPAATLAGGAAPVASSPAGPGSPAAPSPAASAAGAQAPAAPTSAGPASGVGVQVGAFSTNAAAEAAWSKLSSAHPALAGLSHRVVEGKADMTTVFRLQAVASDLGGANALCSKLSAGGLKCQVKR